MQRTDRMARQLLEQARVDTEVPHEAGPAQSDVDLARAVIEDLQPTAAACGIDIVGDSEVTNAPRLGGDAFLFMAALRNVVENAIAAAPEGARVDVTLTHTAGEWVPDVADRGPGIADEDRACVTDRFYRGRQDGSGFGLTIVVTARERLGCRFRLKPREGGGEVATLILPETRQTSTVA